MMANNIFLYSLLVFLIGVFYWLGSLMDDSDKFYRLGDTVTVLEPKLYKGLRAQILPLEYDPMHNDCTKHELYVKVLNITQDHIWVCEENTIL